MTMILRLRSGQVYTHVLNKGGKGGGRPDMAQAGGTEPAKLPHALAEVKSWIEEKL